MTQAKKPQEFSAFELAALAANLAEAKKAKDTLVLDTGKVSYLADYFVICTGQSPAQIRAIVEEIERAFHQRGQERLGTRKDSSSQWCLLDYGDVVIHVMSESERDYYQLEHFWSHASQVSREHWENHQLQRQAS